MSAFTKYLYRFFEKHKIVIFVEKYGIVIVVFLMALGVVEALRGADMLDKVIVVGFDANPLAAQSILAGEMSASAAQDPYNMGALGVESVLKLIKGESIPPIIDTGTVLVTKDNAEEYK